MTKEQLWSGYYMAAMASGMNRSASAAATTADDMVKEHVKRFPDGMIADEERYRNDTA
jgi:hypothetical protein